jgi:hypothetical protein
MTITRKPTRKSGAAIPTTVEIPAVETTPEQPVVDAFIQAAEHVETPDVSTQDAPIAKAKKKSKDKAKSVKKKDKKK